jgi:molybdenum cofactor cytidylyltransferase
MPVVTGVVLAAGASERMGGSKLLLPYRGTTVLNTTIAAVEASAIGSVIVVTGACAEEVEASVESPRVAIVRNPDYRRGNMSSFLTATADDPEAEAFIITPGDMPGIRTSVVDSMIDLWLEERPWAAATEYSDRTAHPFLLSRDAVRSTEEMTGAKVLGRMLIDSGDERVVRLSVLHEAPRDVNTPDDYEGLLAER